MYYGASATEIIGGAACWSRYEDAVSLDCGQELVVDEDIEGANATWSASSYTYFV